MYRVYDLIVERASIDIVREERPIKSKFFKIVLCTYLYVHSTILNFFPFSIYDK